jgi:hypothetical protein
VQRSANDANGARAAVWDEPTSGRCGSEDDIRRESEFCSAATQTPARAARGGPVDRRSAGGGHICAGQRLLQVSSGQSFLEVAHGEAVPNRNLHDGVRNSRVLKLCEQGTFLAHFGRAEE